MYVCQHSPFLHLSSLSVFQDAALQSLKSLNKNDVVEVRAMQRPPDGVRMVIEAVCIMKNIKPKRVAGDKVSNNLYYFS